MFFETDETEETITSLHIGVYHPQASVFKSLNFNEKQKYRGEESIKFGRDSKVCQFPLLDKRASRIQFVIQSFRHADSSELCFEIKNVSLRTQLSVNGVTLDHLNRIDLPNKCILRFGEFQFCLEKESGEDREHFEVKFTLSFVPFCQEGIVEALSHPVTESGVLNVPVTQHQSQTAVETDENELIS
ncbi:TRAF-interacting protein with FHA domain-containing protein A-like [Hypanus sabinus]|uniref:TRAF-interacting protein with FHA domain-containing protein A-like n=1 Tax=Hypanus sabinus TaxID=79690 RepID=UPI0028C4877A|nr:TRAF-interacting protein with FHA domain-containing protein A-like [Hypanus sabinus]XP_059820895.1 TRAF-interacting protein with FHA domain-containing protein A-like [Hypanus sabinus]XP_059820896.1 TRAF-interacting protein with FHA domain-containing protein A-like [Hypanus sabinus]XP_059820897.1 TRAF-interacting protein with FHA domain-containing protein A-like [Hypanus sabinus]XP_059820898.1 TRAF-interacting protein with FHA domain-containing protein A-like [Hypanus sabinus]XP_059820899.1 